MFVDISIYSWAAQLPPQLVNLLDMSMFSPLSVLSR